MIRSDIFDSIILSAVDKFPGVCGIYFLIHKGEVVYVGKSINIPARIKNHKKFGKNFDNFSYVLCEENDLSRMEQEYMNLLSPKLNKVSAVAHTEIIPPEQRSSIKSLIPSLLKDNGINPKELTQCGFPGSAYDWSIDCITSAKFETLAFLCDFFSIKLGRTITLNDLFLVAPAAAPAPEAGEGERE